MASILIIGFTYIGRPQCQPCMCGRVRFRETPPFRPAEIEFHASSHPAQRSGPEGEDICEQSWITTGLFARCPRTCVSDNCKTVKVLHFPSHGRRHRRHQKKRGQHGSRFGLLMESHFFIALSKTHKGLQCCIAFSGNGEWSTLQKYSFHWKSHKRTRFFRGKKAKKKNPAAISRVTERNYGTDTAIYHLQRLDEEEHSVRQAPRKSILSCSYFSKRLAAAE